jgi:hypothetical protein
LEIQMEEKRKKDLEYKQKLEQEELRLEAKV